MARECEREPEVVRALERGDLSRELLRHAEACGVCGEVRAITQQLHAMESSLDEPLEAAASLWWRLNLRMRRQKIEQARMPLVWMGRVCAAAVPLIACLALWQVSLNTRVSYAAIVGVLALAAIALPTAIVLWRWSRS